MRSALVRSARKESLRALGAEVSVGDVTRPETLAPALEGCAGVFSALSAATDREAVEVEYGGNVNLLSAAREAGARRFVYSSALHADHPLAQRVGTFREKARFEEVLFGADDVSATVLRPSMFMETLLLALEGPAAFVMGRQRRPVSWISAGDAALAAVRAFERDITGRHEIAGPDTATFDEAYRRLSAARGGGSSCSTRRFRRCALAGATRHRSRSWPTCSISSTLPGTPPTPRRSGTSWCERSPSRSGPGGFPGRAVRVESFP